MARFGLVVPGGDGHLNPSFALAKQLQRQGHHLLFFATPDTRTAAKAAEIQSVNCAASTIPQGTYPRLMAKLAGGTPPWQLRGVMTTVNAVYRNYLLAVDQWLSQHPGELDCLLVDGLSPHLFLLGEHHSIPYIILDYTAPNFLGSEDVPPMMTTWLPHSETRWGRWRNRWVSRLLSVMMTSLIAGIQRRYIEAWRLPPGSGLNHRRQAVLRLSQVPQAFDFPYRGANRIPALYTGPWSDPTTRPQLAFPWHELTGQPIIYGALGSVYTRQERVYEQIAAACEQLAKQTPVQLVLSVGQQVSEPFLKQLASDYPQFVFVRQAPQIEVLQKAALFITRAGMNSTLEALQAGVPMVALPIGGDQPGVAARIRYHGLGLNLAPKSLTTTRIIDAMEQVLSDGNYKERAEAMAERLKQDAGLQRAANVIEQQRLTPLQPSSF